AGTTPTRLEFKRHQAQARRQRGSHRSQPLLKTFEVEHAAAGQLLAGSGQLLVPGGDLCSSRPGLEERIALLQRAGVAAPHRQEALFHVEQAAINDASSRLAA